MIMDETDPSESKAVSELYSAFSTVVHDAVSWIV
jgi:hypothetical protein